MRLNPTSIPIATVSLVTINVVVFAAGILSNSQEQVIRMYGFIPNDVFYTNPYDSSSTGFDEQPSLPLFYYRSPLESLARLFSSMFIHAGISHLGLNLFALLYLGGFAEKSIGIRRYIFVYLISGIAGALMHGIVSSYILGNGHVVLIGASGAISGVLGIAAATGNAKAYYWLMLQLVFAVIGALTSIPIAFTAHVGGFVAGFILTKMLIKIERKKRMPYWKHPEENGGFWKT